MPPKREGGAVSAARAPGVLTERIGPRNTSPRHAGQVHELDHALAVHSGRACIGYVIQVGRAVVALDHDGIEIGRYESRRLAFAAVTESAIGVWLAPGGAP
jgi:hypothetical protein